jgi:hypothetical protein
MMKKLNVAWVLVLFFIFGCSTKKNSESIKSETKKEKKVEVTLEKNKNVKIKMKVDLEGIFAIINDVSSKVKLKEEIRKKIREKLEEVKVDSKIAIVLGDLKSIGIALEEYKMDLAEVPKVESILELKEVKKFVHLYIKQLPLKDPWGNYYVYKYDKKNPKKYWIASAGKDGKFEGFKKKKKSAQKNDDIILTGDAVSLGPAVF